MSEVQIMSAMIGLKYYKMTYEPHQFIYIKKLKHFTVKKDKLVNLFK